MTQSRSRLTRTTTNNNNNNSSSRQQTNYRCGKLQKLHRKAMTVTPVSYDHDVNSSSSTTTMRRNDNGVISNGRSKGNHNQNVENIITGKLRPYRWYILILAVGLLALLGRDFHFFFDWQSNGGSVDDKNKFIKISPDGKVRVLLTPPDDYDDDYPNACVGSQVTYETTVKILSAHGMNIMNVPLENTAKYLLSNYDAAYNKLIQQRKQDSSSSSSSSSSVPTDAEITVEAINLLNEQAIREGKVLLIQNSRTDIIDDLKQNGAIFTGLIRQNGLDMMICMIKDCSYVVGTTNPLGYTTVAGTGTDDTDNRDADDPHYLCNGRRRREDYDSTNQNKNNKKVHISPTTVKSFLTDHIATNRKQMNRYQTLLPSYSIGQTYEDLFAFESTSTEQVFEASIHAWYLFLNGMMVGQDDDGSTEDEMGNKNKKNNHHRGLDVTIIKKVLQPMQNSQSSSSSSSLLFSKPHIDIIDNYNEILNILQSSSPPLDDYIRQKGTNSQQQQRQDDDMNNGSIVSNDDAEASSKTTSTATNMMLVSKNGTIQEQTSLVELKPRTHFSYRQNIWGIDQLIKIPGTGSNTKTGLGPTSKYQSAVICACPKTGSTSFYDYMFENILGKEFTRVIDATTAKYDFPQNVKSPQWKGAFNKTGLNDYDIVDHLKNNDRTFTLAIVRDPKERLISAWKSKLACDSDGYKTDIFDRRRFVKQLYQQTGTKMKENTKQGGGGGEEEEPCVSFSEYLRLLRKMQTSGKAGQLNPHFRPQHTHCFRHSYPSEWSLVTTVDDPTLPTKFSQAIGLETYQTSMKHAHSSSSSSSAGSTNSTSTSSSSPKKKKKSTFPMTDDDAKILDAITRKDMEFLSEILVTKSNQ